MSSSSEIFFGRDFCWVLGVGIFVRLRALGFCFSRFRLLGVGLGFGDVFRFRVLGCFFG